MAVLHKVDMITLDAEEADPGFEHGMAQRFQCLVRGVGGLILWSGQQANDLENGRRIEASGMGRDYGQRLPQRFAAVVTMQDWRFQSAA
jgi:hypothetical protein